MHRRRERLSAGTTFLLGLLLSFVTLYDGWIHLAGEGLALGFVLLESALPLLADGVLVVVGASLLAGLGTETLARRVGVWTLGGGALVASFAGITFATHTTAGVVESTMFLTHFAAIGGVGGVVGAYFNAEEEHRRRESERERNRLRTLFENSTDCIATTEFTETGAVVTDVNPAFERVFGYDADEIRGTSIDELLAPTRTDEAETLSDRASRGERIETTVERRTADGEVRTFRLQTLPIEEPGLTEPRAGFAVYTDRTEEERFLRQLTGLHDYTRRLMSVADPEEVLREAIPAADELLEFDVVTVFVHDEKRDELEPKLLTDSALEVFEDDIDPLPIEGSVAGRVFREDERAIAADIRTDPDVKNPETPIRSEMIFPLADYGVFVVASTRANAFGDQDVALAEILADNVEAALVRAERETEVRRQKERLDEFASVVSHDLRNPLHAAEGYLELAREENNLEHFDRVERSLKRMDRLVDDLLALARGERTLDIDGAVDIEAVARDAWEHVETGSATLRIEGDPGRLRADRRRLDELFGNLFRNSVEHGSTSSRTGDDDGAERTDGVTITVGGTDRGFYVADDGPGIDPDVRDRLFDMGVTTDPDGTGFGLAIVERIADAHGWTVEVGESESGGARFDIYTAPEDADGEAATVVGSGGK